MLALAMSTWLTSLLEPFAVLGDLQERETTADKVGVREGKYWHMMAALSKLFAHIPSAALFQMMSSSTLSNDQDKSC